MSASAADAQTIAHPKSFLMASSAAHMTPQERTSSFSLASIFALRMFGLFIILPVFAVYARELPGGDSETLVGITLGIYGLTQGLLQIPFGVASDRLGRKPVIIFGLIIFALGSFLAASGRQHLDRYARAHAAGCRGYLRRRYRVHRRQRTRTGPH